jgi:chromosome segregation ATPase
LEYQKQQVHNSEVEYQQLDKKMAREIKELESLRKEKVSQLENTINELELQLHHSHVTSQKLSSKLSELTTERDKLLNDKEEDFRKLDSLTTEKEQLYSSNQSEVTSLTAQLEKLKQDSELIQNVLYYLSIFDTLDT